MGWWWSNVVEMEAFFGLANAFSCSIHLINNNWTQIQIARRIVKWISFMCRDNALSYFASARHTNHREDSTLAKYLFHSFISSVWPNGIHVIWTTRATTTIWILNIIWIFMTRNWVISKSKEPSSHLYAKFEIDTWDLMTLV